MKKIIFIIVASLISLAANAQYYETSEYDFTDPQFNGGPKSDFSLWVNSQLKYPSRANRLRIQGVVYVRFTVDYEGYVRDVKLVRGVEESLDQEALRVVSKSPRWTPGTENGEPINCVMTFPIVFMLNEPYEEPFRSCSEQYLTLH